MNWYKRAERINFSDFEADTRSNDLRYTFGADHGDEFINIITVPLKLGLRSYISIQLDATNRGKLPKSEELKSMLYESLKAVEQYGHVDFFDDHYDPIEAEIPSDSAASYNSSTVIRVVKIAQSWQMKELVKKFAEKWKDTGHKLSELDLIDSWEIKDARYNVIARGESRGIAETADRLFEEDMASMGTFLCKMKKYEAMHPEDSAIVEDLRTMFTKWKWPSMHERKYPGIEVTEEMCQRPLSKSWILNWGSDLPGNSIEEEEEKKRVFYAIVNIK